MTGLYFSSFVDEFCKLAAQPVSREEAEASLRKLQRMEENRDLGETGRAAMVGAAVMPVAGAVTRSISGSQKWLKPGSQVSFRKPLSALRSVNWSGIGRGAAADAAGGAFFGGALPLLREAAERRSRMEKLKDYISQEQGQRRDKTLRQKITTHTGL